MSTPYSRDLRQRVVATFNEGHSLSEVAEMFKIGVSTVRRYVLQFEATGHVEPQPHGGGAPKALTPAEREILRQLQEQHPDKLLRDIQGLLREATGKTVGRVTLGRELRAMGYTRKKKF